MLVARRQAGVHGCMILGIKTNENANNDKLHTPHHVRVNLTVVCTSEVWPSCITCDTAVSLLTALECTLPMSTRCHDRQASTGELTLRDLKEWISEREDVAAFLHNFTEARLIISSLEV